MRSFRYIFLLIIPILFISGCLEPQDPEFRGISGIRFEKGEKGMFIFNLTGVVYNPNKFNIVLTDYEWDVKMNGSPLGIARSDENMTLKKKEESEINIRLETGLKQLGGGILKLITGFFGGETDVNIAVDGWIRAKVKGIPKKVPIEYEDKIELLKKSE